MRPRFVKPLASLILAVGLLISTVGSSWAQSGYIIRPGDTLQIEVLEDSSLNRTVLVLPDGTINFPMAGTVRARGRSPDQLRRSLSTALAPSFASPPNIYVSVAALSEEEDDDTIDVFAVGEFEEPGRLEVKPGITILQFIAEAGGLSRFAADKRIELLRTDPQTGRVTTYRFNYRTPAGSQTGINGGTRLADGDVIRVPQRKLFE